MRQKELKIWITEYHKIEDLPEIEKILVTAALNIVDQAYAPYSNFKVGAAVLLENDEIITGTNQENAAYPSGLCAERVALFYANSKFPNVSVKAIAICAKNQNGLIEIPISPCGSCRQVMLETETRFNRPIKVILTGTKLIQVLENSKQLLPLHFDKDYLD